MDTSWEWVDGYDNTTYTDDMIFEVDYATKKVQKITGQTLISGENRSQFIRFVMDRYYDGVDLSTKNIQIIYLTEDKYSDINTAVCVERSEDQIRFGWLVPAGACYDVGTTTFSIEFVGDEYTLKTQAYDLEVLDGLNGGEVVPEPTDKAWYIELQERCDYVLNEATEAEENAAESAASAAASETNAAASETNAQTYADLARGAAYGSPLTANTASAMTDNTRVYVYTGSETGYAAGHWYYWNGSAWTDGGVYNSVAVDTDKTLTVRGKAADAKVTGDRLTIVEDDIADLKEDVSEIEGISDDVKVALMDVVSHIALWTDGDGQQYYDALYDALYGTPVVPYPDLTTGNILNDCYYDASGNIAQLTQAYINDKYYEIDPNETYIWVRGFNGIVSNDNGVLKGATDIYRVCYYDENKTFIRRDVAPFSVEFGVVESRYYELTPPSNAKYIRLSWSSNQIGQIYKAIPNDVYAIILVLANLNDSTISASSTIMDNITVTRNGVDVTSEVIDGRSTRFSGNYWHDIDNKSYGYGLWFYNIFDINQGGSPEYGSQNLSTRTRIQNQTAFLAKNGDVIHINNVKCAVRAERISDGYVQHTNAWITDNSDFVIGGV